MDKGTASAGRNIASPIVHFFAEEVVANWAKSQATLISNTGAISRDAIEYIHNQVNTAAKGWEHLSVCSAPADLIACQHEMVERLSAEYFAQAKKVGAYIMGVVEAISVESLKPITVPAKNK